MTPRRQRIWAKSNGHCWYCGCTLPEKGWHVDHVLPVGRAGDEYYRPENDIEDNMVPACASCNLNKHAMSVEQFRFMIEHFVDSLNRYHTQYVVAKRYGLVTETPQPVKFWFERQQEAEKEGNA